MAKSKNKSNAAESIEVSDNVADDQTQNSPESVSSTGSGHSGGAPLKVPPLRIVLPSATVTSSSTTSLPVVSTQSTGGATGNGSISDLNTSLNNPSAANSPAAAPASTSSTVNSPSGADANGDETSNGKYPYVMPSEDTDQNDSGVPATTTPTTTSTTRITRSSQRVAQQRHHNNSDNEEHGPTSGVATRKKKNRAGAAAAAAERARLAEAAALAAQNHQNQSSSVYSSTSPPSRMPQDHHHDETLPSSTGPSAMVAVSSVSTSAAPAGVNNVGQMVNATAVNQVLPPILPSPYTYSPASSSYRMHELIREYVTERRKSLKQNVVKEPAGFENYLMVRRDYLTTSTPMREFPQMLTPPATLKPNSPLYHFFTEQEKERQRIRVKHRVEQERIIITFEQEVIRIYNRSSQMQSNQVLPKSVCTFLKDEEVYNLTEFERASVPGAGDNVIIAQIKVEDPQFLNQGPSGISGHGRFRYTARIFHKWLSDLEDKWEKIKREKLKLQVMEAQGLQASQRLYFQWKMIGEDMSGESRYNSAAVASMSICEDWVPCVVVEDFELLTN